MEFNTGIIWLIIIINVIVDTLNININAKYFTKSSFWEYYIDESDACNIATQNRKTIWRIMYGTFYTS